MLRRVECCVTITSWAQWNLFGLWYQFNVLTAMFLRWWSLPQEFRRCDVSLYCFVFFPFWKRHQYLSIIFWQVSQHACQSLKRKTQPQRKHGCVTAKQCRQCWFQTQFLPTQVSTKKPMCSSLRLTKFSLENSNFEGNCLKLKLNESKFNLSILHCPSLQHCNKIGSQHVWS